MSRIQSLVLCYSGSIVALLGKLLELGTPKVTSIAWVIDSIASVVEATFHIPAAIATTIIDRMAVLMAAGIATG